MGAGDADAVAARQVYRTIVALDIAQFSHLDRDDQMRVALRRALQDHLTQTLRGAGLRPWAWSARTTGDGLLVLIDPTVEIARIVLAIISQYAARLSEHNQTADALARLRVRAVVHAGYLLVDSQGPVGEQVTLAFRLLDAAALRKHLNDIPGPLAVALSGWVYDQVVRHRLRGLHPSQFSYFKIDVKETHTHAWIHPAVRAFTQSPKHAGRFQAEPSNQESSSTANRSQFLRATLWAGLGAVLESLRLTLQVEGPAGGPVSHDQLELAVEHYARAYWATPAAVLFDEVRQCRRLVEGMLREGQSARRRRHLHLVAGWLSALLGNLSFHLSDYTAARAHLGTAWRLGQAAGHNGLTAWVRGAQSMVELYDGRPEAALRMARKGQALAVSPLVRAQLASWGEARALARIGDRRGVLEAIGRGTREIECSQEDRSPGGVFSFSFGEFEQYSGTACLWLRLPNEAKRHAENAFQLRDTKAAQALARLDIATAESLLGRHPEAGQIGSDVLMTPRDYMIEPILRRARELAATLEPHGDLAEVRDFNEQLASLTKPGPPWR